jgi:hypothetical protein
MEEVCTAVVLKYLGSGQKLKKICANILQHDVGQLNLLGNTVIGSHNEPRNKVPVSK